MYSINTKFLSYHLSHLKSDTLYIWVVHQNFVEETEPKQIRYQVFLGGGSYKPKNSVFGIRGESQKPKISIQTFGPNFWKFFIFLSIFTLFWYLVFGGPQAKIFRFLVFGGVGKNRKFRCLVFVGGVGKTENFGFRFSGGVVKTENFGFRFLGGQPKTENFEMEFRSTFILNISFKILKFNLVYLLAYRTTTISI